MYTEHKPYEPAFYSSVNNDWGTSLLLAQGTGDRAKCLVDLGHHLPNTNIEQVVSRLAMVGRLGGFHFNDSKYGDDDLTVGSITPFQLFLIVGELLEAGNGRMPDAAYMIDESHNLKDPLEDLIQATDAIQVALAQALCVNRADLADAQQANDPPEPPRCCTGGSAPTCDRSWPRPAAATAPRSTRWPPTGPWATGPRPWRTGAATPWPRACRSPAAGARSSSRRLRRVLDPGVPGRPGRGRPPVVEVVHRHAHGPVPDRRGHLRWDWARLVAEMEKGLAAGRRAGAGGVDRRGHLGRGLRAARPPGRPRGARRSRTGTTAPTGYGPWWTGWAGRRRCTPGPGSSCSRSTRSSRWPPTTGTSWPGPATW